MANKTLLLGDLHLADKVPGYLDAQVNWLIDLCNKYPATILLGDVFDKRKPTPTELLAFKRLLDDAWHCNYWYVLRGNHDTETKSKDSLTSLSLFQSEFVTIIDKPIEIGNWHFIPHYEDESIIIEELKNVRRDNLVFGHFGYTGCINSTGSTDFNISPILFNNKTYLGHIHTFTQKDNITILGTPYTTSFGESGKQSYIGEIHNEGFMWKAAVGGIRHIQTDMEELSSLYDVISDPKYFTLLRIHLRDIKDVDVHAFREDIIKNYNVKYLDIKFIPQFESVQRTNYTPLKPISLINEGIIHKYIEGCNTKIPIERLIEGLNDLKKLEHT